MKITVGIATCNRYDLLAATLLSVALQTLSPDEIIIVDDSNKPTDLREVPAYQHVFQLLNFKKIPFKVFYGRKLGQHYSHELIQKEASSDWIWRLDDDEVAEPDVLAKLARWVAHGKVGAVGGLVPQGPLTSAPADAANIIADLGRPNLQWFSHDAHIMPFEVEHLHSSFLYKKGIACYELGLSPAAHREESLFSYSIFKAGYKLLVDPTAITWHLRASNGGIRSNHPVEFFDRDERIFQERLTEWGVNQEAVKTIVVDAGLGDSVVVKSLLPELKKKYGKLVIAAAHPTIFEDDGCELISIAEAQQRLGPLDRFNVYRFCIDNNWKGPLQDAYRGLFNL